MMFSLMCVILPAALVVGAMALSPSAIAQQEDTSLGDEEEDLARGIVSDVLDSGDDAADSENFQDATNTATEDSNQGQTVDQDDISAFGDDTAKLS